MQAVCKKYSATILLYCVIGKGRYDWWTPISCTTVYGGSMASIESSLFLRRFDPNDPNFVWVTLGAMQTASNDPKSLPPPPRIKYAIFRQHELQP